MKFAVASDIHGSAYWCERLLESYRQNGCDKLVLLGDLMYHGPRNPLPEGYNPAKVAQMLNGHSDAIVAVRGNCDSEVDQMMLDFSCLDDYVIVQQDGTTLFCTHGHLELDDAMSSLDEGSIVLTGHTHIKADEEKGGVRHLNPGSVGIPKDGSHSYLILEDGKPTFIEL